MAIIIYHPDFSLHVTGPGHPEKPERYIAIIDALKLHQLMRKENSFLSVPAPLKAIQLCHPLHYIELVKRECDALMHPPKITLQLSTGDVQICSRSFDIALLAAGSGLIALEAIMKGKYFTAFCAVRPPGHHATPVQGMGFCLFNNAAICARYAQKYYGLKRILIADWDVHHGNGTQDIFYDDPSVFYFSTHQENNYPGTGLSEERGKGNIFNIPILGGRGARQHVLNAFTKTLPDLMDVFKPELIILSAGFDAHQDDPLGGFDLTTEDYATLTLEVKKIAEKHAKGRIVSFLEGGYNVQALAESVCSHVKAL